MLNLSHLRVTRSDLMFRTPGDSDLSSIYGAGSQTLGRGPGFWSGVLDFSLTDRCSASQRRQTELLLVRLRKPGVTFKVPLIRPSGGNLKAPSLTVAGSTLSGGVLTVTVTGVVEGGLVAGDYVQMSGRLYILDSNMAGNEFPVLPAVLPRDGDSVIWSEPYAIGKVDRARDGIESLHDADFSGPWTVPWNEAI